MTTWKKKKINNKSNIWTNTLSKYSQLKKKLQNRNIKLGLTGSFVGHNYSNFETILVDCKIKQTNKYTEVLGAMHASHCRRRQIQIEMGGG